MRLAVLSDFHGNLIALEAALHDLKQQGEVDQLWVLGDLAALGPRPVECIQQTRQLVEDFGKENVRLLRGNTDRDFAHGTRYPLPVAEDADAYAGFVAAMQARDRILNWNLSQLSFEDYTFLSKLERETGLDAPEYGYVIGYHAVPGDDEKPLTPDTPDEEARDLMLDREGRMGIGGHTHIQMDRELGDWRLVNAGSVGMSFQNPGYAQWALLTFENGDARVELRNVPYDTDAFLTDARAVGYPEPDTLRTRFRL